MDIHNTLYLYTLLFSYRKLYLKIGIKDRKHSLIIFLISTALDTFNLFGCKINNEFGHLIKIDKHGSQINGLFNCPNIFENNTWPRQNLFVYCFNWNYLSWKEIFSNHQLDPFEFDNFCNFDLKTIKNLENICL